MTKEYTHEVSVNPTEQPAIPSVLSAVLYSLVVAYAIFVVVSSLAAQVDKFDDAIPLLHGMLIRRGFTPNLDFYSFYPPLHLYLNAAAFKLLGTTVVAARLAADFFYVVVLIVITWFYRSRLPSWGPVIPAAVLLTAVVIAGLITLPVWPGFAVALVALLTYLSAENTGRKRIWLVGISGFLTGLAILFRINFGGYVAAVIAVDFVQRWWFDRKQMDRSRLRSELTMVAAYGIPLVLCLVSLCLWIYGRKIDVAVGEFVVTAQRLMAIRGFKKLDFVTQVTTAITFPAFWFFLRFMNGSGRPSIKALIPAIAGFGVLLIAAAGHTNFRVGMIVAAAEIAFVILMHTFVRRLAASELSLLLFFGCLLHYYLSRVDWMHWRPLPAAVALLLPFLFTSNDADGKPSLESWASKGSMLSVIAMAIFLFTASPDFRPGFSAFPRGLSLMASLIPGRQLTDSERMLGPNAPSRVWTSIYVDPDELAVLRYLRRKTDSSTPLFVGLRDHSRAFWNDMRMYWLADRPIGVRTFQLEAKIATESPVQREIIADLDRNKRTWVILDTSLDFGEGTSPGSQLLDDYIASNFRQEAEFGHFRILTRTAD